MTSNGRHQRAPLSCIFHLVYIVIAVRYLGYNVQLDNHERGF